MSNIDLLQDLFDIEMIKQLKARYFRFIDTKQWEEWRDLFTEDALFETPRMGGDFEDVDTFVNAVQQLLVGATTVTHGHMPEIELTGEGTARGTWAMSDHVEWASEHELRGIAGCGHYEEEYRKVGDSWKISSLRLTRLRVDPLGDAPLRAAI